MFSTSTQKKHWTFSTEDTEILDKIRGEVNQDYIQHFGPILGAQGNAGFFLSPAEEKILTSYYEKKMLELCKRFQPPLPPPVIGSAFHYYKRFYLGHSVMNYHPKIIYPTAVFLACKIEEYNLSIDEFIRVFETDREKMMELIITNELLVITEIKFHLTIHNPYRPVKGLLLDMELKQPELFVQTPLEPIQKLINDFLEKVFFTDVIFFYAPSQIALAAILSAFSKKGKSGSGLDSYVSVHLIPTPDKLIHVVEAVRFIRHQVRRFKFNFSSEQIAGIEAKLRNCGNPENDPDSPKYRKPMSEMDDDDLNHSFGS